MHVKTLTQDSNVPYNVYTLLTLNDAWADQVVEIFCMLVSVM